MVVKDSSFAFTKLNLNREAVDETVLMNIFA